MTQDSQPYTYTEIAHLLNHADQCRHTGKNYYQTISVTLPCHTNTHRTRDSAWDELKSFLEIRSKNQPTALYFAKHGTESLNLAELPSELIHHMNLQRTKLNLKQLCLDEIPVAASSSNEAVDQEGSTERYLKRRSTQNGDGGRKTYVEDSDGSSGATDTKDSDFAEDVPAEPIAKKVKFTIKPPQRPTVAMPVQASGLSHSPLHFQTRSQLDATETPPPYPTSTPSIENNMRFRQVVSLIDESDEQVAGRNDRHAQNKRQKRHNNGQSATRNPAVKVTVPKGRMRDSATASQQSHPRAVSPSPRRVQPHNVGPSADSSPPSRTVQPEVMEQRLNDMSDLLFMLVHEQMRAGQKVTPEIEQRLKSLSRTMKREPGHLTERTLQDITSADAQRLQYQQTLKSLIGHQEFGQDASFPMEPPRSELDTAWRDIRKGIKGAFGTNFPEDSTPKGWKVGFVASYVKDLLDSKKKTMDPKEYIDEVEDYLDNPHIVQTFLGGFVCSRVFATPDPQCEGFYSAKEMKLYEANMLSDGPAVVQLLDKASAKLIFNDDDNEVQKQKFESLVSTMLKECSTILKLALPNVPGFSALNDSHKWMRGALKLKQTLMISPKEYRVHFFLPGTRFDPVSMKAEDDQAFEIRDEQAAGRIVLTCLFPALIELDTAGFDQDTKVADLLVSNKRFLPTQQERKVFNPKTVVSKAFVLLE